MKELIHQVLSMPSGDWTILIIGLCTGAALPFIYLLDIMKDNRELKRILTKKLKRKL